MVSALYNTDVVPITVLVAMAAGSKIKTSREMYDYLTFLQAAVEH
jgi:hypothetical protein